MQTLFKNANVVDVETGEIFATNIVVKNEKIERFIDDFDGNFDGEIVDLCGNFVLPNFVNVFCDSVQAFKNDYGEVDETNKTLVQNIKRLMQAKNLLAGAVYNDVYETHQVVLENISEQSETELSNLSEKVAKDRLRLFLKVGQDLQELGTIDKLYKKTLPQVLEDFGFLDRRPTVIGGNRFEKDELELLSQYDCDICLTVGDDGKNGRKPANLVMLNGLNFCVGMGSGESFEIDFFGFMRQLLMTQRGLFEDKNCVAESDVLKIATLNGAKILTGQDNKIEVGKNASFSVIKNTKSLYNDVLKTLVWEKSKKDVVMTVVSGKILQKNGDFLMKNCASYDTIIMNIQEMLRRK